MLFLSLKIRNNTVRRYLQEKLLLLFHTIFIIIILTATIIVSFVNDPKVLNFLLCNDPKFLNFLLLMILNF